MRNPFDNKLDNTFLAFDPVLFDGKTDITLVPLAGRKHPANPVLKHGLQGAHDEQRVASPFVRVENDKFRMWYVAGDGRFLKYKAGCLDQYQDSYEGFWLCYAQSEDGIHWTQPALEQVEFNGSKGNNIFGKGACPSFLYDPDDPDPNRRYKVVFDWWETKKRIPFSIYTGTSADGIHWNFDFTHNPHESMECPNLYRRGEKIHVLTQVFDPHVTTCDPFARRVNALFESEDFRNWRRIPGIAFQIPRQNPLQPIRDMQCHMGPAVYNAGRFCLGVFGRFIAPSSDPSETRTDLGLCLSDDGQHFFEPFWNFNLVGRPDTEAWDAHMLMQPAGPGLVEVGDEWWMYYTGSRGGNVWGADCAIGIACWRKHGFAYLTTLDPSSEGTMRTIPVNVPDQVSALTVNAMIPTEAKIELYMTGSDFKYKGVVKSGDGVSQEVHWADDFRWQALAGKPVRFSFIMRGRPETVRLYAWEFQMKNG